MSSAPSDHIYRRKSTAHRGDGDEPSIPDVGFKAPSSLVSLISAADRTQAIDITYFLRQASS